MRLPVMPHVPPMLAKAVADVPAGLPVRAEVGRLPLDRVP